MAEKMISVLLASEEKTWSFGPNPGMSLLKMYKDDQ